jgi:hypothetical protein
MYKYVYALIYIYVYIYLYMHICSYIAIKAKDVEIAQKKLSVWNNLFTQKSAGIFIDIYENV